VAELNLQQEEELNKRVDEAHLRIAAKASKTEKEIFRQADQFISAHVNHGELEISTEELATWLQEMINEFGSE
jgi:hypothetical protein